MKTRTIKSNLNQAEELQVLNRLTYDVDEDFINDQYKQVLLDELSMYFNSVNMENVVMIGGQHLMATLIPLLECFIKNKINKIFLVGKSYSNSAMAIDYLTKKYKEKIFIQTNSRQKTLGNFDEYYRKDVFELCKTAENYIVNNNDIKKIIVLDDGGFVFSCLVTNTNIDTSRYNICVVEQTTSGMHMTNTMPFPVISLASSALKGWFEPVWVAEKSIKEMTKALNLLCADEAHLEFKEYFGEEKIKKGACIGVIGLGRIGFAVLLKLADSGFKNFVVYDVDKAVSEKVKTKFITLYGSQCNIITAQDSQPVLLTSLVIFGCTGKNLFPNPQENNLMELLSVSPKLFFSTSSRDIEFNGLLQYIQLKNRGISFNTLNSICYKNGFNFPMIFIRGGTPHTFTNAPSAIDNEYIQFTRALEYIAVMQANYMLDYPKEVRARNYKLDPYMQLCILNIVLNDMKNVFNIESNLLFRNILPFDISTNITNSNLFNFYKNIADFSAGKEIKKNLLIYMLEQYPQFIKCLYEDIQKHIKLQDVHKHINSQDTTLQQFTSQIQICLSILKQFESRSSFAEADCQINMSFFKENLNNIKDIKIDLIDSFCNKCDDKQIKYD